MIINGFCFFVPMALFFSSRFWVYLLQDMASLANRTHDVYSIYLDFRDHIEYLVEYFNS